MTSSLKDALIDSELTVLACLLKPDMSAADRFDPAYLDIKRLLQIAVTISHANPTIRLEGIREMRVALDAHERIAQRELDAITESRRARLETVKAEHAARLKEFADWVASEETALGLDKV